MKRFVCMVLVVSLSASPAILAAQAYYEDVVYLHNGSIIRGTIVEQIPGERVSIRTSDGSVFVFPFEDVERIAKEPRTFSAPRKSPALALVCSLFLTGGGQFYNGQTSKGLIMLLLGIGGTATFITAYPEEETSCGWYYCSTEESGDEALAWVGLAVASATWIWSMIDAPVTAENLNRHRGYSRSEIPLSSGLALSLEPSERESGLVDLGLSVSLGF
jgi:hypothetical protein